MKSAEPLRDLTFDGQSLARMQLTAKWQLLANSHFAGLAHPEELRSPLPFVFVDANLEPAEQSTARSLKVPEKMFYVCPSLEHLSQRFSDPIELNQASLDSGVTECRNEMGASDVIIIDDNSPTAARPQNAGSFIEAPKSFAASPAESRDWGKKLLDDEETLPQEAPIAEVSKKATAAPKRKTKKNGKRQRDLLLDRRCPDNHALDVLKGIPSDYPTWVCDCCGREIGVTEGGVGHCNLCDYDVCPQCLPVDNSVIPVTVPICLPPPPPVVIPVRPDASLMKFLSSAVAYIWHKDVKTPSFESEARREKESPLIIADCIAYLKEILAVVSKLPPTNHQRTAEHLGMLPWSQKYPPARFRQSPFVLELNRIQKWLKTWKLTDSEIDSDEESDAPQSPKQQRSQTSPTSPGSEHYDEAFIFDDRGNRSSSRIARKEQLLREKQENDERLRQLQKGYFSNDTTCLGNTSVEGGEGSLTNIAVLVGPCGIGKTSVAYAAAAAMGYRVVEINTSYKRTPKTLERIFTEATQSKQLQVNTKSVAGRMELNKFEEQAGARKEEQRKMEALEEIKRQEQARQSALDKQKEVEAAKLKAKKDAGIKKTNGLSKSALSNFFKPKHVEHVVVNVDEIDAPTSTAGVTFVDADEIPDAPRPKTIVNLCGEIDSPLRSTSGISTTPLLSMPLILLESGDVLLDDEGKVFYSTVRRLADESKVPIIVTGNDMTWQQATSFFGVGTPHAVMLPPSFINVALEILLVVAVERRYIREDPVSTPVLSEKTGGSVEAALSALVLEVSQFVSQQCPRPDDIRSCLLNAQVYFSHPGSIPASPTTTTGTHPTYERQDALNIAADDLHIQLLRHRVERVGVNTSLQELLSSVHGSGVDDDEDDSLGLKSTPCQPGVSVDSDSSRFHVVGKLNASLIAHRSKTQFWKCRAVASTASLVDVLCMAPALTQKQTKRIVIPV